MATDDFPYRDETVLTSGINAVISALDVIESNTGDGDTTGVTSSSTSSGFPYHDETVLTSGINAILTRLGRIATNTEGGGGGASIDLGITGAEVGKLAMVASVDGTGAPTSWEPGSAYALTDEDKAEIIAAVEDDIRQTLIVTCVTQDGVTVTGQTVTMRDRSATGTVLATKQYEGQPVSFEVSLGQVVYVSVSNTLANHFNPTTATVVVGSSDVAVTLTYSDLSHIQTARDIKNALALGMDLSELPGGTITCAKGSGTLEWVVDNYDPVTNRARLELVNCLGSQNVVFDPAQALKWCDEGLAAGPYKFKYGNAYYYFALTLPVPAGGQLRATTSAFQTYASQTSTAQIEQGSVSTTEIAGATDLGTTGSGSLNHMDRVNYGSNNYGESLINLHVLNSDKAAGTVVHGATKFHRPYTMPIDGLLRDLDPDFLDCIDEADWPCSANTTYECPQELGGVTLKDNTYTVRAKFGLLSMKEVFGSYSGVDAGDALLDLYVGATADDRKKYRGASAQAWWLRSPGATGANYEWYVSSSGGSSSSTAHNACGVVPACTISGSS